jgi:hypothetical protein
VGTFTINAKQNCGDASIVHECRVSPVPLTAESDWVTGVGLEMALNEANDFVIFTDL